MAGKEKDLETLAVHAGEPRPGVLGAVVLPVFQSAMYEVGPDAKPEDLKYIRINNTPNHLALQAKLAALEGGQACVVAASWMAAISTALLAVLSAGDHLLVQDSLYGGTHDFVTKDLPGFGIAYDFIDADKPETWAAKTLPATKAIYVEVMSNPLLRVGDLKAVAKFAKARGMVSMVDNTFAGPVNFRPLEHGFDLSLHSATKSLNGHSDLVAGAVIGSRALVGRVAAKLMNLGGCMDPHQAFLLHRGVKTLALRMARQNASALKIAGFLEKHPAVVRVNYPGLTSHPRHRRAKELFKGCGGVFSFELKGGVAAAERFMRKVSIPISAPSLGGVETLVTRPAATSHRGLSPAERQAAGISDGLVRVSVGIEAVEDLLQDFGRALRA